jgi:valyl-tRNA synthetase
METLAPPAIEAVKSEKIKFIPKRFDKIYFNWMNNIKDWCISRQLWWGHRIPAYYCEKCGEAVVSPSAPAKCPSCGAGSGAAAFRQDDDVLDTWFSSALWPFSTLGFPNDSEDLSYFYPTDVLVTAYDIIFFWVARMIFSGLEQTGKPPFKDVFIHGIIRDELGRKMSKSLGNGIDPMEIIEKYGADTLRLSLVSGVSSGGDMRFSTEKIEGCRNFINKLWNASRYVLLNSEKIKIKPLSECALNNADKWILSKFNDTAKRANAGIEKYEFGAAAATLQEFVRSDFCDWYIELSKPMLYSEQDEKRNDTLNVLSYVLKGILKLLHPFIPFVTEEIYLNLPEAEDTLMLSRYPEFDKKLSFSGAAAETEKLTAAISAIRNVRTQNNVPDNRRVDMLVQTGIAKKRFEDYRLYVEKLCNCKLETVNGGANAAAVNGVVGKAASAATDAKETGAKVSGSKRVNKKATVTKGGIAANGEGANTAAKTEATGGAASAKNVEIITEIGRFIIPLKNLVDFGRERERLQKEIELSRAELDRARQKLSNAGFTGKAPKVLIDAEKEKAEKFKTQIKRLEEQLKNF